MTEELNRQHNLATMPTINNNGESYIVPFDIYKEGYDAYDISNWFKGRVGDNGTPFGIRWYKHGQLMDVTGMRPFIEGQVGDYTIDDSDPDDPKINMDSEASNVHVVGEVNDCQEYGVAIYRLINQAMPQSGIFYGKIGVMGTQDDGTTVMSSVDVVFKVLAGHMSMVGARKFYVSELEKALLDFKAKIKRHDQEYADLVKQHNQEFQDQVKKLKDDTQQVIDDARSTYESETKNAHDSLDALKAQIQANRDEQETLSQHLAGTEQQIQTHDVVTRPEFLGLSNQLSQQVSQMKEAGLEFFNDADDLKAKYPQGANKLCVTLNDSHEWIYDYANGRWNDAGAFNYGTIDPKLTTAIYHNNSDNLIPNSDFFTTDLWELGRDQSNPDCFIEPTERGNALVVNGYVKDGSTNESWAKTPFIDVSNSKYISVGAELALSGIDYNNGKSAMVNFAFKNNSGDIKYYNRYIPATFQDGKFHKITEMHISYPADTVSIAIAFILYGYGTLRIRKPQASFTYNLVPYSSNDLKTKLEYTNSNLLISQPVKDWELGNANHKISIYNNIANFDCSNANDNEYNWIASDYITVNSNKDLVAKVEAQINSNSAKGYLEIKQYTDVDVTNENDNIDNYFINTNELTDYVFDNIKLNPSTKFIQVLVVVHGKSNVKIGKISLKEKNALDLARDKILRSKNLAYDFNHGSWHPLSVSNCISAKENNGITEVTSIDPRWGKLASNKLKIDATKPLNISFNAKSNCTYNSSAFVEISQINKDGEIPDNKNIDLFITKTTNLQKYCFSNIRLDSATKYIQIKIVIHNQGSVWISDFQCNNKVHDASNDLLEDIPLSEWNNNNQYSSFDEKNNIWNISTRNLQDKWTTVSSNLIAVAPGSTIKTEIEANVGILPNNQGKSYIEIKQYPESYSHDNDDTNIDNFITESTDNKFKTFKFVNKLNDDTHYIKVNMVVANNGDFQLRSIKSSYVDEIPNNLPKLKIAVDANITDKWQKAPFRFNDDGRIVEGYVQYAMQGDSSKNYPKKNLKLKFFTDADCKKKLKWKPKSSWDSNHKFNIKANWIDATQSRNLVNSELVKQAISVTPISDSNVANKLLQTQNLGEMEGFPIELNFKDGYYGLMTFNIKKDDKPYGIDSDDPKQEAITNEIPTEKLDNPNDLIDGSHFATVVNDKPSAELQTNFTKFLTFINTASDDDFKKNINSYIDLYSVINLYLFGVWSYEWDYYNKSEILLTYNAGKSYYMLPYDLDSTWRLFWNGSKLNENDVADFATANKAWIEGNGNKLISRIYQLFKPEIKAQWQKLRSSVWTNANAVNEFKNFINSIPESAYEKEQSKWKDIPSKKITNFGQIQQAIIERGNAMDNFMEHLTDPVQSTENKPANAATTADGK